MQRHRTEILAPAGARESLVAGIRAGADAVYLGGKNLNARRGAANFDGDGLTEAAAYCRVRGVKLYQTINTILFDDEIGELEAALEGACRAGVDGIIVQDLAVASMAQGRCGSLPIFASTQMAVHNLDGVKLLEQMGFSRVVLARELSLAELEFIAVRSPLELEVFVHGALCVCVSGQCYLSSMIGGRSGNRGMCAQPCRLPFKSEGDEYALSLKDLSAISMLPRLAEMGIASVKIEGRLKRPEYAAAAVTACRRALSGETPDIDTLRAVFSRSGFTNGYLEESIGDGMFGVRRKEDVESAAGVLKSLAKLYEKEMPRVPVQMDFTAMSNRNAALRVTDNGGADIMVHGPVPETARTAPLTPQRAEPLLAKTGGTPFYLAGSSLRIDDGLNIPASAVNAMRREALVKLEAFRSRTRSHAYERDAKSTHIPRDGPTREGFSGFRVRAGRLEQLSGAILEGARMITLPIDELLRANGDILSRYGAKLSAELPRVYFGDPADFDAPLSILRGKGIRHASVGNLWAIRRAGLHGFIPHGEFALNITNTDALSEYSKLGIADAALSIEISLGRIKSMKASIPVGIIAYGYLPLMILRGRPAGMRNSHYLTDRMGNRFPCIQNGQTTEIFNISPIYLADRMGDWDHVQFATLYFTGETRKECGDVWDAYNLRLPTDRQKTRGLYYRAVK